MSTTKNLGLFKHDNPATNTDEFNVDKALNQNWDKIDEAIGTDRERITTLETDNTTNKQDISEIKAKDTDQDKYIAELEAENTRLREDLNGLPKGQVSGESIDLNDSAEMRCDLKISGNSIQDGEPTPDTPVEVECCGDNVNLYNAPYRENNKLIITATQDDYYKILSYYAYLEAGKKYRVSFESDGSYGMDSGTDTIQIFLMKDKSFDTIITIFSKNEIISPTVSGNYYIRADVNKNGKSHSFWNFKIKKGSTASPYSPYGQGCINEVIDNGLETTDTNYKSQTYTIPTQQPFRAIGDIRDTFIKKNNKWYERHYGSRYIFTGTETVDLQNGGKRVYINLSASGITELLVNPISTSDLTYKLYCNYLTQKTPGNTWNGIQGISYDYNASGDVSYGFDIAINAFTTLQEYLDWFTEKYNEGNPFYVDYVLATPLDIECTEEQSTILFDIEQNAKTYDKVTHMYSTDEISPNVEVTYKKDIETLFNNTLVEGV